METSKSKPLKSPRNTAEIIRENLEEMEKEKRESQEKINRKKKERKVKVRPHNKLQLLNKLKNKKLLLLKEKAEEEEEERVNSDLFNLNNLFITSIMHPQ